MTGAGENVAVPRILFIDAYDSFTHNIVSLLETELGVEATVIKIDEKIDDFVAFLKPFAAVVAGPGPGHPKNPEDVGLISRLWELKNSDVLPVLGICLGFQSLVLAFGGSVEPLPEPRHGMMRNIRTSGEKIFAGVGDISAVQYHSLYASIKDRPCQDDCFYDPDLACDQGSKSLYADLYGLAWDLKEDNCSTDTVLQDENPDSILMAVAHRTKPYFGVQFHPESICSDANAQRVISVWWTITEKWNCTHRCQHHSPLITSNSSPVEPKEVCQPIFNKHTVSRGFPNPRSIVSHNLSTNGIHRKILNGRQALKIHKITSNETANLDVRDETSKHYFELRILSQVLDFGDVTVPEICEELKLITGEVVVFDSECSQRPATGVYSIIGITEPNSLKLEYSIGTHTVCLVQNGKVDEVDFRAYGDTIFSYLKTFMKGYKTRNGDPDIPFWGGLMGYITYEAGLETLGIQSQPNPLDLSFIFIRRSIVIDHAKRKLYVQSIKPNDGDWVSHTTTILKSLKPCNKAISLPRKFKSELLLPDEQFYKTKIDRCQKYLRSGDSYELCLTTEARVWTPQDVSPWSLYLRLRKQNSAPFSTFMRLGPLTHVSSSPERFLSWTRPTKKGPNTSNGSVNGTITKTDHQLTSICQFRPMKGTVRRQRKDPALPPVTLEEATRVLATPKEQAENLMIVDLIRHDLHGVVGSGNVKVTKLMVVEEYATLYQLVTVIEGALLTNHEEDEVIISNGMTESSFNGTSYGDTSDGISNGISNGTSNGGTSNGGASNGAASNGGTSNEDTSNEDTSNEDTSNGGTSNDGTSNGGTSNGGTSNGGTSNGGTSNDGISNGHSNGISDGTSNGTSNGVTDGTHDDKSNSNFDSIAKAYSTDHYNARTSQPCQNRGYTNGTTQSSSQPRTLPSARHNDITGIDVLAASLPPGSMTGAPKKRSCSILQTLEQRNRGVYSGVVGYLDVGGGGDFSVVIRSAFRWDSPPRDPPPHPSAQQPNGEGILKANGRGIDDHDHDCKSERYEKKDQHIDDHDLDYKSERNEEEEEKERGKGKIKSSSTFPASLKSPWIIGAGGAVTCLSTEDGEWEEMCGKLWSTVGVFAGG